MEQNLSNNEEGKRKKIKEQTKYLFLNLLFSDENKS